MIAYEEVLPGEAAAQVQAFLDIYLAAFSPPPYHAGERQLEQLHNTIPAHAARPGYRCVIAREHSTGRPLGFAYGYTGAKGQWWTDQVAQASPSLERDRWLPGHFEFVELAVHPSHQRRGIGGCLHDRLIAGRSEGRALLSTIDEPTPALTLYERRGWVTLHRGLLFAGGDKPYRIMGLRLGGPPGGGGR